MEYFLFVITFATKLVSKFVTNKKMETKINSLDLQGYYAALSKKEKSKLLNYLAANYGMNYSTVRSKLSGQKYVSMNTLDRMAINEAIKKEALWRY